MAGTMPIERSNLLCIRPRNANSSAIGVIMAAARIIAIGPRTCVEKWEGMSSDEFGSFGRKRHSASCSCRTSVARARVTCAAAASVNQPAYWRHGRRRCDATVRGRKRSGRTTFHQTNAVPMSTRASVAHTTGSSSADTTGAIHKNIHGTTNSARTADIQTRIRCPGRGMCTHRKSFSVGHTFRGSQSGNCSGTLDSRAGATVSCRLSVRIALFRAGNDIVYAGPDAIPE